MTVRKLGEADRQKAFTFLARESALNLFFLGNIHNYGMETDFFDLWGDFTEQGELRGVLLRYFGNWIPYAPGEFDVDGFVAIMEDHGEWSELSGADHIIEQFRPYNSLSLDWGSKRMTYFAEMTRESFRPPGGSATLPSLKRMTVQDVKAIIELTRGIEEFTVRPQSEGALRRSLVSGESRGYLAEEGGQMFSMARTAAENPASAMIIGVGTLPGYRGQGVATHLMARLCEEVLADGKTLCLFYDNPKAGQMYKRLGFCDIGFWTMMSKK
ncbi:GNAT family N-acetyltransferase [Marininema halotolerans]|uniref:N-acetyltransferase domain-containing protein n=1 Tax=Marininema halotolerans TaxID=1155944 RepID=A0A1I6U2X2_9BACL|nr:GNAT family N-acetyltransferase [Marininema halotolerans]SFS95800.1 hypothetical protein SAMN05444972_11327 [Marininema halotolerans]